MIEVSVDQAEEEELEETLAVEEVADEDTAIDVIEETLVGERGNEDNDDSPDATASENKAVCDEFADAQDPSGSLQSTLRELYDALATQECKGASVASLLQPLSEYTVTIQANQNQPTRFVCSTHQIS